MSINIIVAATNDGGIGYRNDLPWPRNRDDMKWFKAITFEEVVVMGRNTYDSIGKALPNRVNYCVTNNPFEAPDILFEKGEGFLQRIKERHPDKRIFIIGGANLIDQTMEECDKLYLSIIESEDEADTFINLPKMHEFFNRTVHEDVGYGVKFTIKDRQCK